MSVKQLVILLLIVFAVVSCENFYNDNDDYEEAIAMVESVRIDTVINLTATISLTCITPTPCWHFSRVVDQRDSNQIYLTMYRKAKKYETCIQVISGFTHTMTLSVPTPGTYTLKIYRTPTSTMDTTIVF
ncbi:MAG: hypothetical protein WCW35_12000 [Bacteroidota bacterium]|jgi:hypothetical protein